MQSNSLLRVGIVSGSDGGLYCTSIAVYYTHTQNSNDTDYMRSPIRTMFGITDLYEMQVFVIIRADMQNVTNNIYSIVAN